MHKQFNPHIQSLRDLAMIGPEIWDDNPTDNPTRDGWRTRAGAPTYNPPGDGWRRKAELFQGRVGMAELNHETILMVEIPTPAGIIFYEVKVSPKTTISAIVNAVSIRANNRPMKLRFNGVILQTRFDGLITRVSDTNLVNGSWVQAMPVVPEVVNLI